MMDETRRKGSHIDPNGDLTDRELRFAEEYLVDCSAKNAVIRAGFKVKCPARMGSEILRIPRVKRKIRELRNEIFQKIGFEVQDALRLMVERAEVNPATFTDPETGMVDVSRMTPQDWAAVKELSIDEVEIPAREGDEGGPKLIERRVRLKMHDPIPTTLKLGEHLGMFPNKVQVTGAGGGPVEFTHDMVDKADLVKKVMFMLREAAEQKRSKDREA